MASLVLPVLRGSARRGGRASASSASLLRRPFALAASQEVRRGAQGKAQGKDAWDKKAGPSPQKIREDSYRTGFETKWSGSSARSIPTRFRVDFEPREYQEDKNSKKKGEDPDRTGVYTDHAGLRFPTLETVENYDYHQDQGLDRLRERSFPIKVPGHRRLNPYLREYIHFLHRLDPVRFTIPRIAERYRLREKTVAKVVQEWSVSAWLSRSGLARRRERQVTKEAVILNKKEQMYAKWVGWDELGDEDDPETDDEALGDFRGWRSTSDWVRRQSVEVEMMEAFPMMAKRDPMPKRVDVDMTLASTRTHKVINWLDPTDKVVF